MSYLAKVRHILEEREESLSPHAQKSRLSKGRRVPEAASPFRNEFQRDRDRILHSKAFRRLKLRWSVDALVCAKESLHPTKIKAGIAP